MTDTAKQAPCTNCPDCTQDGRNRWDGPARQWRCACACHFTDTAKQPEPRIVAECWTCGAEVGPAFRPPTGFRKRERLLSARRVRVHRAAGHDVRPVRRDEAQDLRCKHHEPIAIACPDCAYEHDPDVQPVPQQDPTRYAEHIKHGAGWIKR